MRGRLHHISMYLNDTAGTLAAELTLETEQHLSKQAAFNTYLNTSTKDDTNTTEHHDSAAGERTLEA